MTEIVTATVSSDGPLQGAELRIECLRDWAEVYVHLDAIGTHADQWVALQDVDRILTELAYCEDGDPPCVCPLCNEALSDDEPCARVSTEIAYGRSVHGTTVAVHPRCKEAAGYLPSDPLAEVARSHDDRAVARTERRLHDAG